MKVRITDVFMKSLEKITKKKRDKVLDALKKYSKEGNRKGLREHKLNHPSGKVHSISASRKLRIIIYKKKYKNVMYVGNHDEAYEWANRHKFIDEKEGVFEIIPVSKKSRSDENINSGYTSERVERSLEHLRQLGLPKDLIDFLSSASTQEEMLDLASCLSAEFQELIIDTLTEGTPSSIPDSSTVKVIESDEELESAIEYPVDRWRLFLHSNQVRVVKMGNSSRTVLSGGPGTGKTVVLLHRAKRILDRVSRRGTIILTTYSQPLVGEIERLFYKLDNSLLNEIYVLTNDEFKESDKTIRGNKLFLYGERVHHILMDEAHDSGSDFFSEINMILESTNIGCTITVDLNQSIYRGTKSKLSDIIERNGFDDIKLKYTYRITKEILHEIVEKRKELEKVPVKKESMIEELGRDLRTALSGPEVVYLEDRGTKEVFRSLKSIYEPKELFVSNIHRRNLPAHRRKQLRIPELEEEYGDYYTHPLDLKGMEYYAGIVISPSNILNFEYEDKKKDFFECQGSVSFEDGNEISNRIDEIGPEYLDYEFTNNEMYIRWKKSEINKKEKNKLIRMSKVNNRARDIFSRLINDIERGAEYISNDELMDHNLLYVLMSRVRDYLVFSEVK